MPYEYDSPAQCTICDGMKRVFSYIRWRHPQAKENKNWRVAPSIRIFSPQNCSADRQYVTSFDFNFKLAPSAAVASTYSPTEAEPNETMSSTTDSPNKTFTTLQNVVDCPPSPSAVVADLYAEGAATSEAQVTSEEAGDGVVTVDVPVIEDFVYFDPSASIKYEYVIIRTRVKKFKT